MSVASTKYIIPSLFLSHSSPTTIMNKEPVMGMMNDSGKDSSVAQFYKDLPARLGLTGENKPKAIVMVSAHYESSSAILITGQSKYPSLLYDYYGFPKYTYDVKYPAPGNTELANHIKDLLNASNIKAELDMKRNLDHGGFIPLMLMYPDADIPVIQISMNSNYNTLLHLKIGEALRPLRGEGVLFMGSGQASHSRFNPTDAAKSKVFVKAVTDAIAITDDADKPLVETVRAQTMINWRQIKENHAAHPSDDHFLPMLSVIGATGPEEKMTIVGDEWLLGLHSLRTFMFGKTIDQQKEEAALKTEL